MILNSAHAVVLLGHASDYLQTFSSVTSASAEGIHNSASRSIRAKKSILQSYMTHCTGTQALFVTVERARKGLSSLMLLIGHRLLREFDRE